MFWNPAVPRHAHTDDDGRQTRVTVVAGALGPTAALAAPPNSWAARPDSDVAIWTLKMDPGARFTLPAAASGSNRVLYFFRGRALKVGEREIAPMHSVRLRANAAVQIQAGPDAVEILLLQGRPIGEPVVQYGPFVMNTPAEIQRAFADYQRTQFGGWPWQKDDPVHRLTDGRFAKHADGRIEKAP
jgi:redox-sensitive bicupin YhaK (pirin superfamily)